MRIPAGLAWLRGTDAGAAWLAALPGLLAEITERWGLVVGAPYAGSHVSYTAPDSRGPERLVIKLQWPHREAEGEAAVLAVWDGDGVVRLVEYDPLRRALLLERCEPGGYLADAGADDALGTMIGLLPRLWKPAGAPFRHVADEARDWARQLAVRRGDVEARERRLVDAALRLIEDLSATADDGVLVHQDLHAHNVLAARREPWLVIDPKPLVAEREFSVAPVVRSFELGHSRGEVLGRLDRLTGGLGLDRERARAWAIAQTVAWNGDGEHRLRHLQTASWFLDGSVR